MRRSVLFVVSLAAAGLLTPHAHATTLTKQQVMDVCGSSYGAQPGGATGCNKRCGSSNCEYRCGGTTKGSDDCVGVSADKAPGGGGTITGNAGKNRIKPTTSGATLQAPSGGGSKGLTSGTANPSVLNNNPSLLSGGGASGGTPTSKIKSPGGGTTLPTSTGPTMPAR